jgi:hypothetical protein
MNNCQLIRGLVTTLLLSAPSLILADYRLVVELQPQQQQVDLERVATEVFGGSVEVERLFPDVDPADDPFFMSKIFTVHASTESNDRTDWDAAYDLRDAGNFLRVEPDNEDVLVAPTERAVLCREGNDDEATANPAWSLLAVNADKAWELTPPPGGKRFGEGVRICHIDTGWSEHEELDRVDRDSDYDILDGDDDAQDPLNYDGHRGHGTATGSVIASSGGLDANGNVLPPGKITGLAPKATLVPMRSVKSVINFLDSDVAKAVRRSVDAQCDVISMSLGGGAFFGLERALRDAVRRDVIPVAAAGNCVRFVVAPAIYDATIAAAATNIDGKPWKSSSRGRSVDISAPGERVHVARIDSPDNDPTYTERGDGTSFATAYTAAAAALWIAYHGEQAIRDAYGEGTRKDLFLDILKRTAQKPDGWDSDKYGSGILDVAALLQSPLPSPDAAARRASLPETNLLLLSRLTERDPDELAMQLRTLFGSDDIDALMDRYGAELLHIAVSESEKLEAILKIPGDGGAARRSAVSRMELVASDSLLRSMLLPSAPAVVQAGAGAQRQATSRRVLLEIDRMQGTRPVLTEQVIEGENVSLAGIYRAAGVELRIVEDQTDIVRVDSLRLSDLHALLNMHRSLIPEDGEQHVYMLVVSEDDDSPDTLGIMFDFGANDENDVPRESFAIFESAHEQMPGGVTREMLLTSAHELAHVFNLHHTDWDGASFTRNATVESYSLTDTVVWRLSESSTQHLAAHPERLVAPGAGNLPFGLIAQSHADRHKTSPRENYSIVTEDMSMLSRGASINASAAIRTELAPVNDVSSETPLQLRIKSIKDSYVVGEPVTLTVAVINSGDEARDVMPLLSPEYGFLSVLVRGPGEDEFRPFSPPVLREARMAGLSRTLPPNDIMIDDAKVFFGSRGWTFETPGNYEIQATFPADTEFSNDVIRSETLRISIEAPVAGSAGGASRMMFSKGGVGLGTEQGIYLYMGGGDHLEFGASRLRDMVEEYPDAVQADAARLALANEALRPTIDGTTEPEPRLDEAQTYLRGLDDLDNVPGVSLKRVQHKLIEALETEGRETEARSLRDGFGGDEQISRDLDFLDREALERSFD